MDWGSFNYVDDYFHASNNEIYDTINALGSSFISYVLTKSYVDSSCFSPSVKVMSWREERSSLALIQQLLRETGVLVDEICFISNKYEFIKDILPTFAFTILLDDMLEHEFNARPDMRCSLQTLRLIMEEGELFYVGEKPVVNGKGRSILFRKDAYKYPFSYYVLSGGRYFPQYHFLRPFALLAYKIKYNKESGSVKKKFNDEFYLIFRLLIKQYQSVFKSNNSLVCLVPSRKSKEPILTEVVSSLCEELGLDNISSYFECVTIFSRESPRALAVG
mgnify:CR=1 FL=1